MTSPFTDSEKEIVVSTLLDNLVNLLNGELQNQTCLDSKGNLTYKYIITYKKGTNENE